MAGAHSSREASSRSAPRRNALRGASRNTPLRRVSRRDCHVTTTSCFARLPPRLEIDGRGGACVSVSLPGGGALGATTFLSIRALPDKATEAERKKAKKAWPPGRKRWVVHSLRKGFWCGGVHGDPMHFRCVVCVCELTGLPRLQTPMGHQGKEAPTTTDAATIRHHTTPQAMTPQRHAVSTCTTNPKTNTFQVHRLIYI